MRVVRPAPRRGPAPVLVDPCVIVDPLFDFPLAALAPYVSVVDGGSLMSDFVRDLNVGSVRLGDIAYDCFFGGNRP